MSLIVGNYESLFLRYFLISTCFFSHLLRVLLFKCWLNNFGANSDLILLFLFSFLMYFIFKAVLDSQKIWTENTESYLILLPPHRHSFPHNEHLPPEWDISYNLWTYSDTLLSPKVRSIQWGSLFLLYILTNV